SSPPSSASRSAAPLPPASATLSLYDALPIYAGLLGLSRIHFGMPGGQRRRGRRNWTRRAHRAGSRPVTKGAARRCMATSAGFLQDRKSTRLNSSHVKISYAVFCLKKKKTKQQ